MKNYPEKWAHRYTIDPDRTTEQAIINDLENLIINTVPYICMEYEK